MSDAVNGYSISPRTIQEGKKGRKKEKALFTSIRPRLA